jgi:hypothetical protein
MRAWKTVGTREMIAWPSFQMNEIEIQMNEIQGRKSVDYGW